MFIVEFACIYHHSICINWERDPNHIKAPLSLPDDGGSQMFILNATWIKHSQPSLPPIPLIFGCLLAPREGFEWNALKGVTPSLTLFPEQPLNFRPAPKISFLLAIVHTLSLSISLVSRAIESQGEGNSNANQVARS